MVHNLSKEHAVAGSHRHHHTFKTDGIVGRLICHRDMHGQPRLRIEANVFHHTKQVPP